MQLFWGMHGLVLETSIWLLAESTRSQLCNKKVFLIPFKRKLVGVLENAVGLLFRKKKTRQSITTNWSFVGLCVCFFWIVCFVQKRKNRFRLYPSFFKMKKKNIWLCCFLFWPLVWVENCSSKRVAYRVTVFCSTKFRFLRWCKGRRKDVVRANNLIAGAGCAKEHLEYFARRKAKM